MASNEYDDNGGRGTRHDEIVSAAVPVFLRFGYKKASMDAVAAAASLSRQTLYLHFPGKEALFSAVVNSLCESTRKIAHAALWRPGLTLDEQLLAAFDETMPAESMELLAELLASAKELVPQSVANIDELVIGEISDRLHDALAGRQWPVQGVSVEQTAKLLQATSYGLKDQTDSRAAYVSDMKSAINLALTAGGLMPSQRRPRQQKPSTTKESQR
jgi:AcrR family transcriptional regulator